MPNRDESKGASSGSFDGIWRGRNQMHTPNDNEVMYNYILRKYGLTSEANRRLKATFYTDEEFDRKYILETKLKYRKMTLERNLFNTKIFLLY